MKKTKDIKNFCLNKLNINKKKYYNLNLNLKDLKKLVLNGHVIGSHTINHLNLKNAVLYTLIIITTYVAIFPPDIFLNSNYGFFEKHQQMLGFHQTMVTADEHPYCSKWYTWPFMIRPIGYFFESRFNYNWC